MNFNLFLDCFWVLQLIIIQVYQFIFKFAYIFIYFGCGGRPGPKD